MTLRPKVTVYMPTHNRCELISRAIDSVLAQDYPNIELIIVDDGSSDNTWQRLEELSQQHPIIRIFRHEQPKGACAARNLALEHATGSLMTGLDDDDEFLPHRISHLVANFDEGYAFVCTGFLWHYGKRTRAVDATSKIITLAEQLNYNYATNQVLVAKDRLAAVGGFDTEFVACQDYDTWTRLILTFGKAKRIAGSSYVIHRDDAVERITEPTNWLRGHQQYLDKHGHLMSHINKKNQLFRRLIAKRQVLSFFMLPAQLRAGLVSQKIRYFLSSNFSGLAKLRKRLLSR